MKNFQLFLKKLKHPRSFCKLLIDVTQALTDLPSPIILQLRLKYTTSTTINNNVNTQLYGRATAHIL